MNREAEQQGMEHRRRRDTQASFLRLSGLILAGCLTAGAGAGCISAYTEWKIERAIRGAAGDAVPGSRNAVTDAFASFPSDRRMAGTVEMTLTNTLRLATRYSRELQTKRDALALKGLGALAARREFGLQYAGTVGYVLSSSGDSNETRSATAELKASRILPTGGKVSASVAETRDMGTSTNPLPYTTSASVEITQPLLAGAGYDASHEKLIQAEHDLFYALRGFVLDRQDFAIGIVRTYYELLIEQKVLENERRNMEQSVFLRKRSEALFKIRRVPAVDVMRSQQQELFAGNRLALAESEFEIACQRALITLGIPVETRIVLAGDIPALTPMPLDAASSIALALERRLDLKTVRDRRDDARRRLRTAKLALWPKLDVFARATGSGASESADGSGIEKVTSGGVNLELPLDRRPEMEAYKTAELDLEAANRAVDQAAESITVAINESFSRLATLGKNVAIQQKNMELAGRRMDYTLLQFKNGKLSNRDVVEAQTEMLDSKNAYVKALADYEIQRLQLMRDTGCMDVAPDGVVIEMPPSAERKAPPPGGR